MERNRKLVCKRGVRLVVAAFFLQLVGFVTPGWYITEKRIDTRTTTRDNYGVWYVVTCTTGNGCDTLSLISEGKIH